MFLCLGLLVYKFLTYFSNPGIYNDFICNDFIFDVFIFCRINVNLNLERKGLCVFFFNTYVI